MRLVVKPRDNSYAQALEEDQHLISIEQLLNSPNSTCTDIVINNELDFHKDRVKTLATICSKIRYGGTLFLDGVDINVLANYICSCKITNVQPILYDGKQSISNLSQMLGLLSAIGMQTISHKINGIFYQIHCRRPPVND